MKRTTMIKFGVALLALICTFSVVYAMNQELSATGTYLAGGNVTGTVEFKPGDRFYSDTQNPKDSNYMKWMILGTETYTNYANDSCSPSKEVDCNNPSVTAFHTLAYEDIGLSNYGVETSDFITNIFDNRAGAYADYSKSKIAKEMSAFNAKIGSTDQKLLAPRNVTASKNIINQAIEGSGDLWNVCSPAGRMLTAIFNGNQEHGKKFFVNSYDFSGYTGTKYRSYSTHTWTASSYNAESFVYTNLLYNPDGTQGGEAVPNAAVDPEIEYAIRPSAYYDTSNFVFGVSPGTSSGLANIKINELGDASTNLYNDSKAYEIMKLRYEDKALTGSTVLNQLEKKNGTAITKAATDSTIYINASAQKDESKEGVNTVSVLVFEKGKFKYYRPLEPAKGESKYTFDLTGIPKGEYTISIVNEAYNDGLITPAASSRVIGSAPLKIVDMLEIEYKADHETYTYDDNVHVDDVIGRVSFKKGEVPISFEIVATEGHENDYLNFDISPTTESDASKKINVSVKAGAPDVNTDTNSLKAGTYYFTIVGLDKDDEPRDDDGKPMATADVVLVVEKAQPKITFDAEDKSTREITGSKTEAFNFTEHATHTNKDIIQEIPSRNDYDILYTKESGKEGLINTLPQTSSSGGEISLSVTTNQTGSIVLKAFIAETENYKEAETTKTINVVLGLTAEYIEDKTNIKAGSAEAKPSETAIGHIEVSGGKTPYAYNPITGSNHNGSFRIDADGKVYVADDVGESGLAPGDYVIEVEVSDSAATAQKKTVRKTITVLSAELKGVAFENPDKAGEAVTEITRTYDPSQEGGNFHTKLFETIDKSLDGTTIVYSVEDNEFLEYVDMTGSYANFKVKKATDSPIQIKAKVTGGIYGTEGVETSIPVKIEKYAQEIQFEQDNPYDLANTDSCTSIPATKKSAYWNQNDASNKITYKSGDESKVKIDSNGNICPVTGQTGTVTVTATLAGDDNYKEATATITINLLGEVKLEYEESTPLKQAVNPDKTGDTGNAKDEAIFGPVSVTGGIDKRYDIQIKSDDYAYLYFELVPITDNQRTSTLKLKSGKSITATILKEGITKGVIEQDTTNKDQYNWKIKVLPDTKTEPQEIIVHIIGADPILTFEKEVEGKLTTTYEKDGSIDLSVKRGDSVMDTGISVEGTIGYSTYIKDVSSFTTDAQLNGTGIIKSNCDDDDHVLSGKDFKLTPKAEASDGYKSGTGTPTPVIIKKADHPDVDFVDPDTILSSYIQSVDKGFTGILTDDEHLEITPQGESTWSGTTFTKFNKGDTTVPSVTITPNGFEGTITYVVNGGGTANYKPIENKEIHLAFAAEGGISYKPIKITYGDDTKKVIDYISDADKAKNTYTYAPVEGNTYVNDEGEELFTLDDSTSTITTIQVGKTKVNVTRTDEKGNVITQAIPVEIVKKEITLTYESNTIYTGEALPTPAFKEPAEGVLVGNDTIDDFPIPTEAAHYDGTEVLMDSETTGTYDTKGNWTNDELTTEVNPNYKVTIKAGKLTIKKDSVKDNWYHLEDPDGKTVSKTAWHNYLVDVVLDTATGTAGTYDQISNTKTFTDTDKTRFTVTKEDENTEDVYFRIDPDSEAEHKGAITSTQTTVKIDMTKPNVTKVTGYPVNTDGLSELIHNLTFGMFFKPGVEITIETEDPQPAGETGITVSGVHTVSYKVYKLGEKGEFDPTQTPKVDEGKVDANGKISFKINDVGNYRVCAIAKDNATNPSNESCSDVNVKKVNVDIDGDGTNDFVDSDDNGCPDLNILLGNDSDGNPVKLNVAEKNKNYPYMNIDSDGDGKADLNIDTDHDGKPDLNLVILTEKDWVPKKCVVVDKLKDYTDPIEYCTGTDAKAVINVDTDGDGIPDINIDTDGNMKPDINIDTDNDGEANTNINTIESWIPKTDHLFNGFPYDTMGDLEGYLNVDSNGDGYPDINIDLDGDGIADINIDTDNDGIPNVDIDSTGDGKPDTNIDTTGDGKPNEKIVDLTEWKPDKIIKGDVPYGTMDLVGEKELADGGIIVEKPDGSFLPNNAIKVNENTDEISEAVKKELDSILGDQEIGKGYEILYYNGSTQGQPSGNVKVKIPVDESIKNPKIIIRQKDGSFKEINYTMEDGYWVYETDYIDQVYVTSDKESIVVPDPDQTSNNTNDNQTSNSSVKGAYTDQKQNSQGMGGASTGDQTNFIVYGCSSIFSLLCLCVVLKRRRRM